MFSPDPKDYLWLNICTLMGIESPTVDAVQRKTKVGRGTIQRIKEGETSVGTDKLRDIADALGVETWRLLLPPGNLPPGNLLGEPPVLYAESGPVSDGYYRLPVLAEASAGNGRENQPEILRYVDVLESYVRRQLGVNPRSLKILTARGNSMTGQIEDGDIMFVEQTNEFTDDGIYILTLDTLIRVKRLSVSTLSQQVIIESNDGRKAEELPLKEVRDRLHIQGRVVGAWSLKRFS